MHEGSRCRIDDDAGAQRPTRSFGGELLPRDPHEPLELVERERDREVAGGRDQPARSLDAALAEERCEIIDRRDRSREIRRYRASRAPGLAMV